MQIIKRNYQTTTESWLAVNYIFTPKIISHVLGEKTGSGLTIQIQRGEKATVKLIYLKASVKLLALHK